MNASIHDILRNDSKRLEATLDLDSGSARIEVQCLLQAALKVDLAYLLTHAEQLLNDEQLSHYTALFERRLTGEPIAYLLASREFYGLIFKVSPATLIPRPETELLVELAVQRIPQPLSRSSRDKERPGEVMECERNEDVFRVLDLGTGSGAIALSIAHARPDTEVVAVDASEDALRVARENARLLNIVNVLLLHSDWFSALHCKRFDLIVSNPPYVAANDAHLSQGDLRFEPRSALASGADGLDDIRHICAQAKAHLNPGRWLMLEHGYNQAAQVRTLMQQAGYSDVFSAKDLSGIERVSGGSFLP